ncbi:nitroreductase [Paenibacillus selenitireducens]|uniref:Putative NAD(P)H nitroreductase n=1 Tax=Paenibacillus selenitireducens TaxID=1324314 RepID=A0A1T2X8I5_9BACL|nr:nitroreductase [Paenibacillus selenitireducens]OPA76187.1 nitroreductase [Paenibacillus selenitireducens]
MDIHTAIATRRSIGKVKSDPVSREDIEKMLEAATWAPNHRHTEPWKFFVMEGEGRGVLGRAYADIALDGVTGLSTEEEAQQRSTHEKKAFRSPVIIAVAVTPSSGPQISEIEEFAAAHAAVQNMLLTAHSLGLGAVWRTGDPTYHPKMRAAFQLEAREHLVGFVYVGYPDMDTPKSSRVPFAQKTVWLNA